MAGAFPTSVTIYTNPTGTDKINVAVGGRTLDQYISDLCDDIEQVETKLGTGASTASANTVLRGTGAGATAFGSVQTADMVSNAVHQIGFAVASTTNPTVSTNAFTDLTDMSVTLTTTGGDLLAWFCGSFQSNTVDASITVALKLDAAAEVGDIAYQHHTTGLWLPISTVYRFTGVTVASHTIKTRWAISSGTATNNFTQRNLLVMEVKR